MFSGFQLYVLLRNFFQPQSFQSLFYSSLPPQAVATSTLAIVEASPTPVDAFFILPDLITPCNFPLTYHPDGDAVAAESTSWIEKRCPEFTEKQRLALHGLQAGELTAFCYVKVSRARLRVVSDFMNFLFHLDNISDGMMTRETATLADTVMNAFWVPEYYAPTLKNGKVQPDIEPSGGQLARDFWTRCVAGAGYGTQARFKETMGLFFNAVNIEAHARDEGSIPDLESYIDVRRDTSGCKPCWVLLEYALDIDLPEYVVEHPVIAALNRATNDLVTWSNDIFSYNVEQARGDKHNMIMILMRHQGYSLQGAIDYVGNLCDQTISDFTANKENLPSWDPEIDNMVQRYVEGLQDWIVGSLHWSFQTKRYFGDEGATVKTSRVVKVMPLKMA